jgi:tetratricopeptide (TPR) repeat protein
LNEEDVARFIEGMGHSPSDELVSSLYATTEGNPFFVAETIRLLESEGKLGDRSPGIAIPMGARMLIGRRLNRLSADCNELLAIASVSGTTFSGEVLGRISDLTGDHLLEVLDEAIAAGVVEEVPGSVGRYRFAHALIRETLYEELSTARRIRIHRAIAEVLEQIPAPGESALADIARHYFESAKGGNIDKAIHYTRKAGDRAGELLAYEEAVLQYQRALQLFELKDRPDETARIELLLALGAAQARAGEAMRSRETFFEAADLARRIGAPELRAHAALGFGGGLETSEVSGSVDETAVRLVQDAIAALPQEDSALRSRLLGRLAAATYWSAPVEQRESLSRQAVDMARRIGDPGVLLAALSSRRYALWSPEAISDRVSGTQEILRLAEEVGDKERVLQAHRWLLTDHLERGDIPAAIGEIEMHVRLSAELRQKIYIGYSSMFRAMHALWEGRLDDAERHAREAQVIGASIGHGLAAGLFYAQMFRILWERGELDVLEQTMARMRESLGGTGLLTASSAPALTATLALALAEFGRTDEARPLFDRLCGEDVRDVPRGFHWLVAIGHLAGTCALIRDTRRARPLYELLAPFGDRLVVGGPPPFTVFGPVSYFLGLLAAMLGRTEAAADHFDVALAIANAMSARPMIARTLLEQARLSRESDPARASALATQAAAIATDVGMRDIAERAGSLLGAQATPAEATAGGALFRREGDFWALSFSGAVFRLKDQKGLGYIARLLRAPGTEMAALDLAGSVLEAPGDAGEVLDPAARADYRRRLTDLAEELDDAEQNNDEGRAAKAREEIDALTEQLASAVGLGGRARRASSVPERARVSVRNAIASTLKVIRRHDEAMWRHLSKAVRTGNVCVYDPEQPTPWEL